MGAGKATPQSDRIWELNHASRRRRDTWGRSLALSSRELSRSLKAVENGVSGVRQFCEPDTLGGCPAPGSRHGKGPGST